MGLGVGRIMSTKSWGGGFRTCYRPTRVEGLMGYKGSSFRKRKGPWRLQG